MILIRGRTCVIAAGLVLTGVVVAPAQAARLPAATRFTQVNLISDLPGRAMLRDPKLVNPWGVALGQVSGAWVANTGTNSSTFYFGGAGGVVKAPLNVAVEGGSPTGQVANPTAGFRVRGMPAMFIFDSESGHITAWNLATAHKAVKVASVKGANYKGLALTRTPRGPMLLAADFHNGRIEVFDRNFRRVALPAGAFRDRSLPGNYAPFNVAAFGGAVYVAYAQQDDEREDEVRGPGKGYVTVFTPTGHKVRRFASRGALNAPWAVVRAPRSFGTYAGNILVGNFGDGRINAYDSRGRSRGPLRLKNGGPIQISGLWGLAQGNVFAGGPSNLWFAAGIEREQHGLMGLISPAR